MTPWRDNRHEGIFPVSAGVSEDKGMGIFSGAVYESVQQSPHSAVGHCQAGGLLYHVYQPVRFLQAAADCKKDRNKGSRSGTIRAAFFIWKMRKRKVFALGLPCCLAFLIAMSQFVWAIDFEGNISITDDVLLDFLAENGVDYGVAKNKVDIEALEAGLRENFDIITWTSARIEGTHFIVKIKENDLAVEEETEDDKENWPGSNLVATQDGVVVSILTRQGVPKVTEGTSVQKGDILVSGAVPVMADDGTVREYQFCHADADVALVYEIPVHEEQPLLYEYKNYTNREKKDLFFHWDINATY